MPIPPAIAAKVLFNSDRTCCVCRIKGKPVQIHHIDGNNKNNNLENLAVLCFDCHTETQLAGGFHRKLDSEQVILYRNDWNNVVQRERALNPVYVYSKKMESSEIEALTSITEILRESKQYERLAMHYHSIGNAELRDKYIKKVLNRRPSPQTTIFLRALQNRADLIPEDIIKEETERLKNNKDWCQLARLFVDIKRWDDAVQYYCKGIVESLQKGNIFSAAFYLKEMSSVEKLQNRLFEIAYDQATKEKNLWWQIRALQELGWNSELTELLKANKVEIEKSGDPMMMLLLYRSLGNQRRYVETMKKMYQRKLEVFNNENKKNENA